MFLLNRQLLLISTIAIYLKILLMPQVFTHLHITFSNLLYPSLFSFMNLYCLLVYIRISILVSPSNVGLFCRMNYLLFTNCMVYRQIPESHQPAKNWHRLLIFFTKSDEELLSMPSTLFYIILYCLYYYVEFLGLFV